jgi:DNA-binding NarL/FixJ family response regulator
MGELIRVLVADDQPLMRAGLKAALEENGFAVCAEAGDASSAVQPALVKRPQICLLDIRMPGNGLAASAEISSRLPESVVVLLAPPKNETYLFDAISVGAAGYLFRDMNPERLPNVLHGVLRGEAALPRRLVTNLVLEFRRRERRKQLLAFRRGDTRLTRREWDVLELMVQGERTGEIAERLFVSPATVRSHIRSLLRKLEVKSRASAIDLFKRSSG